MKSQAEWLELIKTDSCWSCHQLGNKATREIPDSPRQVRFAGEGVGAPHPIGTGRQADGRRHRTPGQGARPRDVRRLDHPHRRRRTAARAAASPGRRAQRRDHAVGLGRSESLPARRDRHRQTQPHRQRQRPALRRARAVSTDNMPVLDPVRHTATQVKMPVRDPKTPGARQAAAAFALLGRRSHLGQPGQHAQPDVRREGPRLVHLGDPSAGESGVLQGRIEPSFGEAVPAESQRPPTAVVRSEDASSSRSSTPASARTTCSSPRTPTTRCGPAAAAAAAWSAG